ncbi:MAG: outer membrane beta-barrel protein [Bacteroidota bacterium]
MKYYYFTLFILFSFFMKAQMPGMSGGMGNMKNMKDPKLGRVFGKVLDAKTNQPVEYASVQVLWFNKDSLLGGSLVKENGDFAVDGLPSFGQVRVRIKFIGYKDYLQKVFIVPPDKIDQDLGDIKLSVDDKLLNEVDVVAEKSAVVLSIDKRTYNVDKDLSVKGGTAVDVMKNIPGLTVDADGNVQLRNQSPMIYVDGRPTTLTLQQIPADQIDRVEIITNPSVKFDASTTGGVLNVIMKKNNKPGYNGMLMLYAGTGDRYGGMGNINIKEGGKWNFSLMYSYNQAINNTKGYTRRDQINNDVKTGYFNQDNATRMKNLFNFGRLGIDYNIDNRNTISLNGMIVGGQFKTNDVQNYTLGSYSSIIPYSLGGTQVNDQKANFQNYNGQILYKKTFPKVGKELTVDANYNYTDSKNGYLFSRDGAINDTLFLPTTYQRNAGYSNANQYIFQADYVNPISDTRKFEAGIKSYYKKSLSSNNTDTTSGNESNYQKNLAMSNRYIIDDMINAAYVNYSAKTFWDIGYQAGLRFEQSYYKGTITDKNQSFSYNYPSTSNDILKSLFPALYFSKKLKKNQEVQINFSRKINRPNFFQLMPFVMFADKQNYRIGNPQLKPEFKNIAEANYNKILTKGSYLASGYFRYEEQPITDVAYPSQTDPNVLVNTSINGDNSIRYGIENTFKYTLVKNLDWTINVNAYYIYIRGLVVPTEPVVKAEGYAYNAKTTLSYKFPKQFTLQVNGNYESPKILLLGVAKEIYSMDVSLNKMIGTKWIFNATLSDVFNTRRMGTHYVTPYYIQDLSRRRESRYFRFTVTYLFGKMDASIFKRGKQMKGMGGQEGNQDGLDFK